MLIQVIPSLFLQAISHCFVDNTAFPNYGPFGIAFELQETALLTDGRFSGGSHGFVVGHICPEAQVLLMSFSYYWIGLLLVSQVKTVSATDRMCFKWFSGRWSYWIN